MTNACPDAPAVLITGSSTGIGASSALELVKRGYRVFAGVRRKEDGDRLREQAGAGLEPVLLDVTDSAAIAAAAQALGDKLAGRGLYALINNAGIVVSGPLEILPLDEFRRQFEVNVFGQLAMIQAMLPLLRAGRGRIINVSSLNGALSAPYLGPYSASKHALEAVSDALRIELRQWNIPVSLIEPGPIRTPIWEKSRSAAERLADLIPAEKLAMYDQDLTAIRAASERMAANSIPVERVVAKVVLAITDRRPRARYYGIFFSRVCFKGMRYLPERLRDWLVCRAMGLK